jgi:hypothetical protein
LHPRARVRRSQFQGSPRHGNGRGPGPRHHRPGRPELPLGGAGQVEPRGGRDHPRRLLDELLRALREGRPEERGERPGARRKRWRGPGQYRHSPAHGLQGLHDRGLAGKERLPAGVLPPGRTIRSGASPLARWGQLGAIKAFGRDRASLKLGKRICAAERAEHRQLPGHELRAAGADRDQWPRCRPRPQLLGGREAPGERAMPRQRRPIPRDRQVRPVQQHGPRHVPLPQEHLLPRHTPGRALRGRLPGQEGDREDGEGGHRQRGG